jgi:hypothetical protein
MISALRRLHWDSSGPLMKAPNAAPAESRAKYFHNRFTCDESDNSARLTIVTQFKLFFNRVLRRVQVAQGVPEIEAP